MADDFQIGTQVTTPYGIGIVTWVEIGADEFQVMMYDSPPTDGYSLGLPPKVYKTVDREHLAFWPPRLAPVSEPTP